MTDDPMTKLQDQEFTFAFPLFIVGVFANGEEGVLPVEIDVVELDGYQAIVIFTDQLHAEQHSSDFFEGSQVRPLRSTEEFQKHCREFQNSLNVTHVMFDPTDEGSMLVPISQFID